jgi:hypothetical protein
VDRKNKKVYEKISGVDRSTGKVNKKIKKVYKKI